MTGEPLPAPLVPLDCDCRGLPFMPLDVVRLRESDLTAVSSGDEFKAAVLLWCAAWNQSPAASLPDDDRVLARLAGYGAREWAALREVALRGWVKCSDGRLYHPVVAEKALEAWRGRVRQRDRAAKRWAKEPPHDAPALPRHSRGSTVAMQGTGTGTGTESASANAEGRARKGCRLPEDWQPSDLDRAYAARLGFSAPMVERIAERFRDYWHAKAGSGAYKLDWSAAWRKWTSEEAERRGVDAGDKALVSNIQ